MPQKSRIALKQLFSTGNLNEGDFIDWIDSKFNIIDDVIDGSMILDGSITANEISASALTYLNTIDGLRAWDVNQDGDFLPASSHFQDIGSLLDTVKEIHADDLIVYQSSTLPINTSIGTVSSTEISYLYGATSNLQQQIDNIAGGGGIGNGGVLTYTHIQVIPSVLWTIVHNRGSENVVYTLLDEDKYEVYPDSFRVIDINTVEFSFADTQLGKVNMVFY